MTLTVHCAQGLNILFGQDPSIFNVGLLVKAGENFNLILNELSKLSYLMYYWIAFFFGDLFVYSTICISRYERREMLLTKWLCKYIIKGYLIFLLTKKITIFINTTTYKILFMKGKVAIKVHVVMTWWGTKYCSFYWLYVLCNLEVLMAI